MQHPQHGFHHAYTDVEEAEMRANGWTREGEVAQAGESTPGGFARSLTPEPRPVAFDATPFPMVKRKPGRPRKVR